MFNGIKEKITSPCIKVCKANWKGYCVGCYRDILEITHWATMSEDERKRVIAETQERKKSQKNPRRISNIEKNE
jgi:predicted Fe-S protein YdhL (DUF1289 family)